MFSLTEDSGARSSLEAFTAKGSVFSQPRDGPGSKAVTWSMSAISPEVRATFLREKHTGNLLSHKVQGSCGEDYCFPFLSGGAGAPAL
jgi:hypothetical protein